MHSRLIRHQRCPWMQTSAFVAQKMENQGPGGGLCPFRRMSTRRSTRQDAQINYLSTLTIFMKQTTYLATLPNPEIPFQYSKSIMTTDLKNNLHDIGSFFTDVKNYTLPAVSYIKPADIVDGHPGTSTSAMF